MRDFGMLGDGIGSPSPLTDEGGCGAFVGGGGGGGALPCADDTVLTDPGMGGTLLARLGGAGTLGGSSDVSSCGNPRL